MGQVFETWPTCAKSENNKNRVHMGTARGSRCRDSRGKRGSQRAKQTKSQRGSPDQKYTEGFKLLPKNSNKSAKALDRRKMPFICSTNIE